MSESFSYKTAQASESLSLHIHFKLSDTMSFSCIHLPHEPVLLIITQSRLSHLGCHEVGMFHLGTSSHVTHI